MAGPLEISESELQTLLAQTYGPPETWSEDEAERARLLADQQKCIAFLEGHSWCDGVTEAQLAYGIGGIASLFLNRIQSNGAIDEWLWCVVGDLPSAYFVLDDSLDAAEAFETYAQLMEDWAASVLANDDEADVYPVAAPRTAGNAQRLLGRLALLREDVIPDARDMLEEMRKQ